MRSPGKEFKSQSDVLRGRLRNQFPDLYGKNPLLDSPRLSSGSKYNGNAPCAYFDGVFSYFNANAEAYHAKFKGMTWNGPCAENISYSIDLKGSMASYRYLLSKINKYSITLYNGDWDDVVPYIDTLKNMRKLNLEPNND